MANEHRRITKIFKRGRLPAAYFSTAATMALSYGSYCTPKGRRRSERESARMRRGLSVVHSLLHLQDEFFQVRILPFVPPYVHLCVRLRLVSQSWHETFTEWATHATADYMRMKKPMNFYVKEWRYYFPALNSLDLSGCYFICDKELKLCACYLGWHLSELSVHGCKKLGSGGMLTVSECCANLKSLDVGCSSVSIWSVKLVVQACRSLTALNLDKKYFVPLDLQCFFSSERLVQIITPMHPDTYEVQENQLRHLSVRGARARLETGAVARLPLAVINLGHLEVIDISNLESSTKDILALIYRNPTLLMFRDDGTTKTVGAHFPDEVFACGVSGNGDTFECGSVRWVRQKA